MTKAGPSGRRPPEGGRERGQRDRPSDGGAERDRPSDGGVEAEADPDRPSDEGVEAQPDRAAEARFDDRTLRHQDPEEVTVVVCELCGGPTKELHCKIICLNCGFKRDCSDP